MKIQFLSCALGFLAACGTSAGGRSAQVTARFVNGPTSAATQLNFASLRNSLLFFPSGNHFEPLTTPENGRWLLTPTKATYHVTQISLSGGEGEDPVTVACDVTTDSTQAGLAVLKDCPFS